MSVVAYISSEQEAKQLFSWGMKLSHGLSRRKKNGPKLLLLHGDKEDSALATCLEEICKSYWHEQETIAAKPEPDSESDTGAESEAESDSKSKDAPKILLRSIYAVDEADEKAPKDKTSPCDLILGILRKEDPSFLLISKDSTKQSRLIASSSLAMDLFEKSPCSVVMMRNQKEDPNKTMRALVPAGLGPHSSFAMQAASYFLEEDGALTALHIEDSYSADSHDLADKKLSSILNNSKLEEGIEINKKIVLSDDVWKSIAAEAKCGYELIVVGASHTSAIRRALFGSVPDKLLSQKGQDDISIAVVRQQWPWVDRFRSRFERWLDLTIPQLTRDERVGLFEKLQNGSSWNFDFFALISLSTLIAALGLLQNSAAVVIGAMLVAPLMTPILGAGLALVQGNFPLIQRCAFSIVAGFLTALSVGAILGLLVPLPELTPELTARGGPTLLDLFVAFFSGLAAAHCSARTGLSAALPGVAIAAALVPPIATVGISFSMGETSNAKGAALLFGINVLTIILGAACSFYSGGIRPRPSTSGPKWVRYALLALILLCGSLILPLGSVLISKLAPKPVVTKELQDWVSKRVEQWPTAKMESIEKTHGSGRSPNSPLHLELRICAPSLPAKAQVDALTKALKRKTNKEIKLRVRCSLQLEANSEDL